MIQKEVPVLVDNILYVQESIAALIAITHTYVQNNTILIRMYVNTLQQHMHILMRAATGMHANRTSDVTDHAGV